MFRHFNFVRLLVAAWVTKKIPAQIVGSFRWSADDMDDDDGDDADDANLSRLYQTLTSSQPWNTSTSCECFFSAGHRLSLVLLPLFLSISLSLLLLPPSCFLNFLGEGHVGSFNLLPGAIILAFAAKLDSGIHFDRAAQLDVDDDDDDVDVDVDDAEGSDGKTKGTLFLAAPLNRWTLLYRFEKYAAIFVFLLCAY